MKNFSGSKSPVYFLSKLEKNVLGKSDRPKCFTSVEIAKLYKTYFGEESETNG